MTSGLSCGKDSVVFLQSQGFLISVNCHILKSSTEISIIRRQYISKGGDFNTKNSLSKEVSGVQRIAAVKNVFCNTDGKNRLCILMIDWNGKGNLSCKGEKYTLNVTALIVQDFKEVKCFKFPLDVAPELTTKQCMTTFIVDGPAFLFCELKRARIQYFSINLCSAKESTHQTITKKSCTVDDARGNWTTVTLQSFSAVSTHRIFNLTVVNIPNRHEIGEKGIHAVHVCVTESRCRFCGASIPNGLRVEKSECKTVPSCYSSCISFIQFYLPEKKRKCNYDVILITKYGEMLVCKDGIVNTIHDIPRFQVTGILILHEKQTVVILHDEYQRIALLIDPLSPNRRKSLNNVTQVVVGDFLGLGRSQLVTVGIDGISKPYIFKIYKETTWPDEMIMNVEILDKSCTQDEPCAPLIEIEALMETDEIIPNRRYQMEERLIATMKHHICQHNAVLIRLKDTILLKSRGLHNAISSLSLLSSEDTFKSETISNAYNPMLNLINEEKVNAISECNTPPLIVVKEIRKMRVGSMLFISALVENCSCYHFSELALHIFSCSKFVTLVSIDCTVLDQRCNELGSIENLLGQGNSSKTKSPFICSDISQRATCWIVGSFDKLLDKGLNPHNWTIKLSFRIQHSAETHFATLTALELNTIEIDDKADHLGITAINSYIKKYKIDTAGYSIKVFLSIIEGQLEFVQYRNTKIWQCRSRGPFYFVCFQILPDSETSANLLVMCRNEMQEKLCLSALRHSLPSNILVKDCC